MLSAFERSTAVKLLVWTTRVPGSSGFKVSSNRSVPTSLTWVSRSLFVSVSVKAATCKSASNGFSCKRTSGEWLMMSYVTMSKPASSSPPAGLLLGVTVHRRDNELHIRHAKPPGKLLR